jgi:type VII secretion integral membrane protein EccD
MYEEKGLSGSLLAEKTSYFLLPHIHFGGVNRGLFELVHLGMGTLRKTGSGEMCRLTICGPTSQIELAVPAHVPVADLLPTFLDHLGPELTAAGFDHDGWLLQRLGEPPLDEDLGTAALGLYDGDVLHLRPRAGQLPPVDFDDLVDGVAASTADRPDRWQPAMTRRLLLGLVGATLGLGVVVAPMSGTGALSAIVAGMTAVVLLLGAAAASRALGDRTAGVLLGIGSVAFTAAAGMVLPAHGPGTGLVTAAGLLAAGAWAAIMSVLVGAAVGGGLAGFVAAAFAAVLAALGGLLVSVAGLRVAAAAAIVLAVTVLLGSAVPLIASRLAGLRVPPLPTTADEFQQGIDPEPSPTVLSRTARAHDHIGSLYVALGVVAAGCLPVLGTTRGIIAPVLAAVASFFLLLHARELLGVRPRLAVFAPGAIGLAVVLLALTMRAPARERPAVVVLLVMAAGILLAVAQTLPGRKLLPHWGRVADITHTATAIAIIPLVLAVAGGASIAASPLGAARTAEVRHAQQA